MCDSVIEQSCFACLTDYTPLVFFGPDLPDVQSTGQQPKATENKQTDWMDFAIPGDVLGSQQGVKISDADQSVPDDAPMPDSCMPVSDTMHTQHISKMPKRHKKAKINAQSASLFSLIRVPAEMMCKDTCPAECTDANITSKMQNALAVLNGPRSFQHAHKRTTKLFVQAHVPPTADRKITAEAYDWLVQKSGLQPTVDCCCADDGSNALCEKYYCPSKSMLQADLQGECCWINPPFSHAAEFLRHYVACKAKAPNTTSALVMIPAWCYDTCKQYLSGMHKMHVFKPGTVLFTEPTPSGLRHHLPGVPWPVHVYMDKPCTPMPGVDMKFKVTVNSTFEATTLMDSGADNHFISADLCQRLNLTTAPVDGTVQLGDKNA